jgi:hypothetical protein
MPRAQKVREFISRYIKSRGQRDQGNDFGFNPHAMEGMRESFQQFLMKFSKHKKV